MELFRVHFLTKIVIVRILQKLRFEIKESQEHQLFRTKTSILFSMKVIRQRELSAGVN